MKVLGTSKLPIDPYLYKAFLSNELFVVVKTSSERVPCGAFVTKLTYPWSGALVQLSELLEIPVKSAFAMLANSANV